MPFAKIIVTNSTTTGAQPNPLDLSIGELTLNVADGKLFALDTSNNVVKLSDKGFETRLSSLEGNPGVWGSIAGTITNQTDLKDLLDTKLDTSALVNTLINTDGITDGTRITLTPNYGPDQSFDLVHENGDDISVTTVDDVITVKHLDTTRTNTSDTDTPAFGDAFNVVSTVSSNGKGHITGVETSTITLPSIQTFENRLDAIEYLQIDITSFDASPSTELYEFEGSATYDLDFNWNTNKTPTTITLASDLANYSPPTLTSADTSYDEPAFQVSNTSGAEVEHTWTLSVTDSQNTSSSTKTIRWVYPFFHGAGATDLSAGSGIESLTKLVARKEDTTFPINVTNQFIYFAYPDTYGDLSAILDGNGLDVTSSFAKFDSVNVTPASSGVARPYKIYKSNAVTTINQNFQIKF